MKEIFTRQAIAANIEQCRKRFPATICFTVALTAYLLFLTWAETDEIGKRLKFAIGYYLSAGCVLTLSLRLWGEEFKRRRNKIAAQIVAHTLLAADLLYLLLMPEERFGMESGLGHASILTALCLTLPVLPFFREQDDTASWNFTLQLIHHACAAILIGLLMTGGLSLLAASLDALFGIDVKSEVYLTFWILCSQLLGTLLFLGRIPHGNGKHERTAHTSEFLNKVIRYLLLPLSGCYLAVLYGYTVKILVEMQLPDGWITKLVTTLMLGCLCMEAGFYPAIRQDGRKLEQTVARWLPILILPMVALMSIAIGRRMADYGITVSRLYVLALNVWFYIVCIGLFLTRARRIHWLPVSFAALFLLVSALPANFVDLTRKHIRNEIHAMLEETYKGDLPMSQTSYTKWLNAMPLEKADRASSLLAYMDYTLSDPETDRIVDKEKKGWFSYYSRRVDDATEVHENSCPTNAVIAIPEGFTALQHFRKDTDSARIRKDSLVFSFRIDGSSPREIHISLNTLKQMDKEQDMKPLTVHADDNCRIVLTQYWLRRDNKEGSLMPDNKIHFNYTGYIFTRK